MLITLSYHNAPPRASVWRGETAAGRTVDCRKHAEDEDILRAACRHTLHIFLFISAFNLALGAFLAAKGKRDIIQTVEKPVLAIKPERTFSVKAEK